MQKRVGIKSKKSTKIIKEFRLRQNKRILQIDKKKLRTIKNQSLLKSVLKQNDSFIIDVRISVFENHLKKKDK